VSETYAPRSTTTYRLAAGVERARRVPGYGVARVVALRIFRSIPLLFVVSGSVFLLMSLSPGNVTESILGPKGVSGVPASAYAQLAHQLGIDRPLYAQYWNWLSAVSHGDLGHSITRSGQPVTQAIEQRFPVTISLTAGALVISVLVGVGLGILSAARGGFLGRVVDATAMIGWVVPVYWAAAELVVIFAVKLNWLPATGYVPFSQSPGQWLRSLVLPVVALSLTAIGGFAKFVRDAMLEALSSEYVRVARANGMSPLSIVFRHAFRSASLQVVTLAGLMVIQLLIGTVFVETVFALPGLGSLMVGAAFAKDIPMAQGVAVFFTLIVVVTNLLVDLLYAALNPRVHLT